MRIVHLAAEFAPLAKAGGLGEAVAGLCRELTRLGEQVDVVIPKYDFINVHNLRDLKMEIPDLKSLENGNLHANAIWSASCADCRLHLLDARHPAGYFHRRKIYGCKDDTARFLYFSRACLEYLKLKKEPIDILHLHDWHVAACAPLVRDLFRLPVKTLLLTIHNAEYQGKCATWDLDAIGLKGVDYLVKEKMQDDHPAQPKTINLLKGGVVYADAITTVSPTYAKEILTSEIGFHLDVTLRKHKAKLSGILNGLDLQNWDPAHDPHLLLPYSAANSLNAIADAKHSAREILQKRFDLAENHRPWVGAIARLVSQKSPELLLEGLHQTLKQGGTFLLLGSSAQPALQAQFEKLKSKQLLLHFAYDEELSHQIYAALDLFLIPSRYEPCGLTQMVAMHYGTVPIARATGGLKDTVFDCEDPAVAVKQRNGFLFSKASPASFNETLQRALTLFRSDPATFQSLIRNGMQIDFSWKKSAREYLRLYQAKASRMPS